MISAVNSPKSMAAKFSIPNSVIVSPAQSEIALPSWSTAAVLMIFASLELKQQNLLVIDVQKYPLHVELYWRHKPAPCFFASTFSASSHEERSITTIMATAIASEVGSNAKEKLPGVATVVAVAAVPAVYDMETPYAETEKVLDAAAAPAADAALIPVFAAAAIVAPPRYAL
jgi:hypothetical protein